MRIERVVILLAGSIASDCPPDRARYAHAVVHATIAELSARGGRFAIMPGRPPPLGEHGLPLAFDWEMIRVLAQALEHGAAPRAAGAPLVTCTLTQKTLGRIPSEYRPAWDALQSADALALQFVPSGWSSGAVRRTRAAESADVLVAIGGGEGVEHLAAEFLRRGKPVVPIDLGICGSSKDGSGGASKILGELLAAARPPFTLGDGSSPARLLARFAFGVGDRTAAEVSVDLAAALERLRDPRAFFVRLLARDDANYPAVESFFRNVVDPVIADLGYDKFEMGATPSPVAWMNQEIFWHLAQCALAVVDLTSLRFNCGIELGFALGRNKRLIVTAREGTRLPFDLGQFKIHFWSGADPAVERQALMDHYQLVRERAPVAD